MIKSYNHKLNTKKKFEIIDITNILKSYVKRSKIKNGILSISTRHTTTSIRVNEKEPLLLKDIEKFFIDISKNEEYLHDDISKRNNCPKNEPKNACAHIQALLMGSSETIPINDHALVLGKWQHVFFIELDGPRIRSFDVSIIE